MAPSAEATPNFCVYDAWSSVTASATAVVMVTITQYGGRGAGWGARRGGRVGATTGATPGARGATIAARVAPRGLDLHLVEQLQLGDQTARRINLGERVQRARLARGGVGSRTYALTT